jgi:hypothetical protein
MSAWSRREALAGLGRAVLALGAARAAARAEASDVPAARGRLLGHPRSRFPLPLFAAPAPEAPLDAALRDAVDEWNALFRQTLGVAAFAWQEREAAAQVILRFAPPDPAGRLMGETRLDADDAGTLRVPVEITVHEPVARGQTPAGRLLFQIAAHELGHALGLPHLNEPASLMCCDRGALDFGNAAVRDAYIAARRQPTVQTAAAQLAAHYRQFWGLAPR